MFSGLVTAVSSVLEVQEQNSILSLTLKRPEDFKTLKTGESISVDGVCLTLRKFDDQSMVFDLSSETLKVTKWTAEKIKNKKFNLEQSLSLQSALGGQILTGHTDALAEVISYQKEGESCLLTVQVPKEFKEFIWKKGYLALNGVSLTVNKVKKNRSDFCLIPETLKRTNLSLLKKGDMLNFEVDYTARSFVNSFQSFYKKIKGLIIICLFFILILFVVYRFNW